MGERSLQVVNFRPAFRPSRQIVSHFRLRNNADEINRKLSGIIASPTTSIIAPDLLISQTIQSNVSSKVSHRTCPVFKAWLRGVYLDPSTTSCLLSLMSSAISRLRPAESQSASDVIKSEFPPMTGFSRYLKLDIAGTA